MTSFDPLFVSFLDMFNPAISMPPTSHLQGHLSPIIALELWRISYPHWSCRYISISNIFYQHPELSKLRSQTLHANGRRAPRLRTGACSLYVDTPGLLHVRSACSNAPTDLCQLASREQTAHDCVRSAKKIAVVGLICKEVRRCVARGTPAKLLGADLT